MYRDLVEADASISRRAAWELHYRRQRTKELVPRALRARAKSGGAKMTGALHRGEGFHCPCCEQSFRETWRGRCPGCLAGDRPRLLAVFITRELGVGRTPAALLHFAPEPGLSQVFRRSPMLDYVAADLDPRPGSTQVDMTAIDLPQRFDGIVASHVLEHIPNDLQAMRELYRVLVPGGWALLVVPLFDEPYEDTDHRTPRQRHDAFGQVDHVRLYDSATFESRLRSVGFCVEIRDYNSEIDTADRERMALSCIEPLFVCHKPAAPTTS